MQQFSCQKLRNLARCNFECKTLGNGCFTYAGFTDKTRIVLRPTAKDLNNSFDFFLSADNGVDLALSCNCSQVTSELVERRGFRFTLGLGFCLGACFVLRNIDILRNLLGNVGGGNIHILKNVHCVATVVTDNCDQKMLRADISVAETSCDTDRGFDYIFASRSKIVRREHSRRSDSDTVSDGGFDIVRRNVSCSQSGVCHAALTCQQAEQKMLAADICVAEILRVFDCGVERRISFLSKACKLIHKNLSL